MVTISKKEELILLAIINLESEAYLVSIQKYLTEVTKQKHLLTAIHVPLGRLEEKGLINYSIGESTAVRGGRSKKIYSVTKKGLKVLSEYSEINNTLWKKFGNLTFGLF